MPLVDIFVVLDFMGANYSLRMENGQIISLLGFNGNSCLVIFLVDRGGKLLFTYGSH